MPITPAQLARDAAAVAALGVSSIHVHPRDVAGGESLDPRTIAATVDAIRSVAPEMEIGVTTARWVEPDPYARTALVAQWGRLPRRARPDVAAVNVHERGWEAVCAALDAVGIGVELGVWTTGDAVQLRQRGVPPGTVRVLAEVTIADPDVAVAEGARIVRSLGPLTVPVLLHGEEAAAWPVLDYARRSGLDHRIGFEDTLCGPDDRRPASGNAELVGHALDASALRRRRLPAVGWRTWWRRSRPNGTHRR